METNKIGFWGTEGSYGCFSNFYPCIFQFNGRTFNCSEQAFMWMKAVTFGDFEISEQILEEVDQKLNNDEIISNKGNYTSFLKQKEEEIKQKEKAIEKQEQQKEKLKTLVKSSGLK